MSRTRYQKSLNGYFKVVQVVSRGLATLVDQIKEQFSFEMDTKLEALLEVYAPAAEDVLVAKANSNN